MDALTQWPCTWGSPRLQTVAMATPEGSAFALPSPGKTGRMDGRTAGLWGWAFVVLLLVSAGMASVPGGDDPTDTVRDFYVRHTGIVVAAQLLGLLAAAAFVLFTIRLRQVTGTRSRGALATSGVGVGGASVITAIPVLWLAVVSDAGANGLVHALAVGSDLVDVLLFAAIAVWLTNLVRAAQRVWFKALAGTGAVLAVARALLLLVGSGVLELLAPLTFVVVVAALSTLLFLRRSPLGRP